MRRRRLVLGIAVLLLAGGPTPARAAPAARAVNGEARRLAPERVVVPPRTGAPTYEITSEAIQNQPGAENNSLTQVLLQAPGVSQDASSVGGLHVRNQMGNLQYRINGVALPEGATLFGQNGGGSPPPGASRPPRPRARPAPAGLPPT